MQRIDVTDTAIDIEEDSRFIGLLYMNAEGMNNVGKAKNVYTETYADSKSLRVFLPKHSTLSGLVHSTSDITNEATKITMRFLVVGDASSRQATINNFRDYVREGVHRYWDDARNLVFDFIVTEEFKVSDEKWHGSQPYVEIEVAMQNLDGKTRLIPPAPTITGTTPFTEATQVSISLEPLVAGASIHYTINGTTPTQSSSQYSGPIDIRDTRTIKAIAVLEGVSSQVASKTFTKS